MNARTNTAKPEDKELQAQPEKKKTCFVIMPIADIQGYDSGHFTRVYNHLIKPACEAAGFKAIRADDINSSHMIIVDILKKIVESDIAICDLSGRNPNVLYELGLRQAFNKKTILIKDNKTENIFDVQGFRHSQYDSALRIDNVNNEIVKIKNSIEETFNSKNDINSIVQLLEIEPAEIVNKTKLSDSDTIILRSISELSRKIEDINKNEKNQHYMFIDEKIPPTPSPLRNHSFSSILKKTKNIRNYVGDAFKLGDMKLTFVDISTSEDTFVFIDSDGQVISLDIDDQELDFIKYNPF
ncbi:hypothetical protein [Pectobacterium versatile]|uniref:hypothetical protein n=1 Tax=Pectobacterium versatile TaxID=2488639 RepID=UPI0037FB7561